MTQDEFFQDLKQYIAAENRALEKRLEDSLSQKMDEKLEEKLEAKLEAKLAPIRQDIADLSQFVQDAITTSNDANQEQIDNHEVRITRLEQNAA